MATASRSVSTTKASVYGYGMSADDDLRPGVRVSGAYRVAEALYRRITSRRKSLQGYPDYGIDLHDFVNAEHGPLWQQRIRVLVASECCKDPRVKSLSVAVNEVATEKGAVVVSVSGTCLAGPFRLTAGIDDVTVKLLGIVA